MEEYFGASFLVFKHFKKNIQHNMKIAIIGYGKMGKTIERLAIAQGHTVPLTFDLNNIEELTPDNLQQVDVAIEFTTPSSAVSNIIKCFEAGIPVIVGTTAWHDDLPKVTAACEKYNGTLLHATNFSIGVNIFFAINEQLAHMMDEFEVYNPTMEEIHHTQKLDAPSGTGITLAEGILSRLGRKDKWVNQAATSSNELALVSKRIDKVPGTHIVTYSSPIDSIEIKHTAHSREGFAVGAIQAAAWAIGKKGVFTVRDMLGF